VNYRAYIQSNAWRDVKRRYRASKLPQGCYICGSRPVDLHHKTYKRLGREHLTDLLPLCRTHHDATHTLLNAKRSEGANPAKWNYWTAAKRLKRQLG
jgi:hypothetical protein